MKVEGLLPLPCDGSLSCLPPPYLSRYVNPNPLTPVHAITTRPISKDDRLTSSTRGVFHLVPLPATARLFCTLLFRTSPASQHILYKQTYIYGVGHQSFIHFLTRDPYPPRDESSPPLTTKTLPAPPASFPTHLFTTYLPSRVNRPGRLSVRRLYPSTHPPLPTYYYLETDTSSRYRATIIITTLQTPRPHQSDRRRHAPPPAHRPLHHPRRHRRL